MTTFTLSSSVRQHITAVSTAVLLRRRPTPRRCLLSPTLSLCPILNSEIQMCVDGLSGQIVTHAEAMHSAHLIDVMLVTRTLLSLFISLHFIT